MVKRAFNMTARTVKLLGRENIASSEAAMIELVKNCYDAEGRLGLIIMDVGHVKREEDAIYIIDNGSGMDSDTIEEYWMTIGTDNKELNSTTTDGRIKSGAKGIGRLALDRLGNYTLMYTQKEKQNVVKWEVFWGDFERQGANINDVYADINILEKECLNKFVDGISKKNSELEMILAQYTFNSGTIIKITDLRDDWTEDKIEKFYKSMNTIVPPTNKSLFSIYFHEVEFPERYGLVLPIISEEYDYKIEAVSDDTGISVKLYRNEFDKDLTDNSIFEIDSMGKFPFDYDTYQKGFYVRRYTYDELLPSYELETGKKIFDEVGPFEFELYYMKNTTGGGLDGKYPYKYFNESERRKWLKQFSGIKIYRDNFRVRPYGEIDNDSFDWLHLDERARKSPAAPSHLSGRWRLRANQTAGTISISRMTNVNIKDMANRQAIDESEKAFSVFKELLIALIDEMERDRQTIMRAMSIAEEKKNPDYQENIEAKKIARKVNKIAQKKDKEPVKESPDEKKVEWEEHITLAKSYTNREKAYKKEKKVLVNEIQLLRVMASTGLTISTFGHELKSISSALGNRVSLFRGMMEKYIDLEEMEQLEDQDYNPYVLLGDIEKKDYQLKNWMNITLSNIRKDKRARKNLDMVIVLESIRRLWTDILKENDTEIYYETNLTSIYLRALESDFESIFGNLISNSVEAFKRKDGGDTRNIKITLGRENDNIVIDYEDSGPGLLKEITDPEKIFESLYTTKRNSNGEMDGTGLGMWITRNIISDYKGQTKLTKVRDGFAIRFLIPLRKGE